MHTLQELIDDRARGVEAQDLIIRTAKDESRDLTEKEVADLEYLDAALTEREQEIARARKADHVDQLVTRSEARRAFDGPNINTITVAPPTATRSLDEVLWATDEAVRTESGALNPVEQVIVRSDVNDEGVQAPRINEFTPEHRGLIRSFQETVADMAIFGLMLEGSDAKTSKQGFEVARSHRLFKDRWNHIVRAMDVDTSAEGGTWVPTGIGASLHEKVRAEGRVAPLFQRIQIPTNPWKWPIEGADATAYRVGEPTGDTESKMTASTPGTVAATFDAEIFGARALFSRSLEADSALAILPYVQRKIVQAFVAAEEKAILDGDSDGTHQDADVGSSTTDPRTAWDGLRKKALAQTAVNSNAATSAAVLGAVRAAMGKWGLNPMDLAFIVGVSAMHDLLLDSALLTVDKLGPQATILNGQIGTLYGVPVIVSEHVRENLNASGVQDGITVNETYNLCVNRNEWAIGQRMALDVVVNDVIYLETFQRVVVGFQREDFQHIGDAATNDDTAIGYGINP